MLMWASSAMLYHHLAMYWSKRLRFIVHLFSFGLCFAVLLCYFALTLLCQSDACWLCKYVYMYTFTLSMNQSKMLSIYRKLLHWTTTCQLVTEIFLCWFLTPLSFPIPPPPILLSLNQTPNVLFCCCLFCWFLKTVSIFLFTGSNF